MPGVPKTHIIKALEELAYGPAVETTNAREYRGEYGGSMEHAAPLICLPLAQACEEMR